MLSGYWVERKTKSHADNFAMYLENLGVEQEKAEFIAKTKKSVLSMKFYGGNPMIFTIIGALVPDDNPRNAKISMNYTKVKADNQTMYPMPMNMLTGNTNTTHVIFGWEPGSLTLYAVDKSKYNRRISFEWHISPNSPNEVRETWIHVPTGKSVAFYFDRFNKTGHPGKFKC